MLWIPCSAKYLRNNNIGSCCWGNRRSASSPRDARYREFCGRSSCIDYVWICWGCFTCGTAISTFWTPIGLTAGFLASGVGAIGVVISATTNNIFLLFASLLIYGAGTATNLQARYAGTISSKAYTASNCN